jgi:hypothetical protein
VDDITARTPCELLTPVRKTVKVVAHGIAEVPRGQFIAWIFIKDMLESKLTEWNRDGRTWTLRSMEATVRHY